jgi:diadenylate cyclase
MKENNVVYLLRNLEREVRYMMSFQFDQLLDLKYWQQIISSDFLSRDFVINIIDILVVWYLVYKLIMLVRGTKAVQLLKGVAVFIVIRILSEVIGLHTLSWLMNQVIMYGVIAAVVIFQPEVRRGLEHLGRSSFFRPNKTAQQKDEKMILAFDKAIQYMSKRKIGALITIERNTGLDEYIETGIDLDADITGELLINIFIPNTPLHDGAVIIKKEKIAVASAYLPLSESQLIPKEFGTRHRAAVGISEVSDAVTIVVSEETGDVSLTLDNELIPGLSQEEYLTILRRELIPSETSTNKKSALQHFIDDVTKGGSRK